MPCYSPTDAEMREANRQELERDLKETSDYLCQICTAMERGGDLDSLPIGLQRWWDRHKENDQREKIRRAQEAEYRKNEKVRKALEERALFEKLKKKYEP